MYWSNNFSTYQCTFVVVFCVTVASCPTAIGSVQDHARKMLDQMVRRLRVFFTDTCQDRLEAKRGLPAHFLLRKHSSSKNQCTSLGQDPVNELGRLHEHFLQWRQTLQSALLMRNAGQRTEVSAGLKFGQLAHYDAAVQDAGHQTVNDVMSDYENTIVLIPAPEKTTRQSAVSIPLALAFHIRFYMMVNGAQAAKYQQEVYLRCKTKKRTAATDLCKCCMILLSMICCANRRIQRRHNICSVCV